MNDAKLIIYHICVLIYYCFLFKPLYKNIKKRSLPEKGLAVWTKVIACTYGLVCLAIAFLAQYLGGILQSALTIFSVVGGPLFGVFTLGMFTLGANESVLKV